MEIYKNITNRAVSVLMLGVLFLSLPTNVYSAYEESDDYEPRTVDEMIVYLYGMIAQLQALIDLQNDIDSSDFDDVSVTRKSTSKKIDVDTLNASDIGDDDADLRGRLDLEDERYATVWFEYGESKSDLDERTSKKKLYDSSGEVRTFTVNVDDLEEDEKYYYQAVGEDRNGKKSYGSIKSFTTDDDGRSSGSKTKSDDGFKLTISDTSINEGDKIVVDWEVPDGDESPSNWIGLYERGDSNKRHKQYRYIADDVKGTVEFNVYDEGEYEIRLFLDNSYDDEIKSYRFEVD